MARQNIDGGDFIGKNTAPNAGRLKLNENFTELYASQPPLATDDFDETDPITDYPSGFSIMPVSAAADWDGWATDGTVVTDRTGSVGRQEITFDGEPDFAYRVWDSSGSTWGSWQYPLVGRPASLALGATDTITESSTPSSMTTGLVVVPVTSGANFGPNAGQAGHVVVENDGTNARQTFHQYSNSTSYERTYTGGAWGSWQSDEVDLAAHIADTSDAHDASAISYLGSTNLAATEVEAALDELDTEKASTGSVTTVQTNLTNHIDDTTDAHDASAISYLGSTNLAATEVEAALDELDTEKASTGSVTTVQTNLTSHIDDTSDAHDASAISIADSANQYTATHVEDALAEVLDALQAHEADSSGAHAASAISFTPDGSIAATNVQTAIQEVRDEATGGTGLSLTEVEKNLGSTPKTSGSFQITGLSGLTADDPVLIRQTVGPYTGKGTRADEYELDSINVGGKVANATTIQCYWRSDSWVRGNYKFVYAVG